MSELILTGHNIHKTYCDGSDEVSVLKGIDLHVAAGECLAIIGPSGSGKSTLLHVLGGLDNPTKGTVCLEGVDWQKVSEKKRCQLRNRHLGFIYQFHHLLPEFSALENVAMPLLLSGMKPQKASKLALDILEHVDLKHRVEHKPAHLSGGERQRVAIARALVHAPQCVLADEPTGNLDQSTADRVFDLMLDLNKKFNTALVVVTHDKRLAGRMDKVLVLDGGVLYP